MKDSLPYGAFKEIAEKTGYSEQLVRLVLSNKRPINKDNKVIVKEAARIYNECVNLKKEIAKTVAIVNPINPVSDATY